MTVACCFDLRSLKDYHEMLPKVRMRIFVFIYLIKPGHGSQRGVAQKHSSDTRLWPEVRSGGMILPWLPEAVHQYSGHYFHSKTVVMMFYSSSVDHIIALFRSVQKDKRKKQWEFHSGLSIPSKKKNLVVLWVSCHQKFRTYTKIENSLHHRDPTSTTAGLWLVLSPLYLSPWRSLNST